MKNCADNKGNYFPSRDRVFFKVIYNNQINDFTGNPLRG